MPMLAATAATLDAAGIPCGLGGCWPTLAMDDRH
jgi:hypothetical protein